MWEIKALLAYLGMALFEACLDDAACLLCPGLSVRVEGTRVADVHQGGTGGRHGPAVGELQHVGDQGLIPCRVVV